ncbi:protein TALPID3 [Arapaima gigas]
MGVISFLFRTRPQQHTVLLPMSPSTADLDQPGFASRRLATSALGSTSQGASDAQAHFNWMKADLQVQPGDAFALEARKPTQASGSMRPTVSTPLPYPHVATPEECPSCQPVEIQKSLPPPSVLENARKNFQGVCHRRKILDENLEAMCRARDREAFYALLDSISCTGDITEKMRIKKTVDAWMWFSRKGMQNTPSETKSVQEAEEYLKNIYGKDLFKSNHRTQKTSPYLRCTSPSKKSKGQRSSTVDRVKGVKVKSAKTQTSPFRGQALSPVRYTKQQNIFRPTPGGYRNPHEVPPNLLEDFLLPMAIPLGKPRVYDMGRQSSCVVAEDQPITTTSSIAQSSPRTAASKARRPNATVLEVRSAKKGLPQLQVQVLPSVNIDSVSSESLEDSPSPPPPSPSIQTVRQTVVELEPEEEEREVDNVFPGTEFLAVADITQEPQAAEQLEDIVIQLNGIGEPPAPLYHGPVPHPQAPDPPAAVDTSLSAILEREGLESRLVEWVEQQVMARTVTELSLQPDKFESASFSEEQDSSASTSNIAEAASRASPLFVLTGIPVDSELVRQYVDEALAETVALFLGQREGQSPVPPATVRDDAPAKQEPVVCTPVPTPSPRESPSHGAVPLPLATPEASEQECVSSKEAQYTLPEGVWGHADLMNTPHTTPAASPPRPSTPSPPPTLWSPEPVNLQSEPWGGRERPLEEETEPCGNEELQQQLVMSVAREEESVSLISPTPSILPEPLPPPPHSPRQETPPPRPTPSTEDSSSVLSITETDMLGRHISEGELVMSCGQMTAVRGLLEEGLVFPNLNGSLSSSLHGLQDMEYDPPSEGQLPRRRDPVLSLLGKMNQGLISHQEEACTNEALWEIDSSSLELSDEQRSRLSRQHVEDLRISSPGQVSLPPGVTGGHLPGRHHPVSMEHLEEGVAAHVEPQIPNDPSHCKDAKSMASEMMVHSVAKPAPILVRQYQEKPTHAEEGDASPSTAITALHENVAVHLSSASQNGGSVSISTVEGDTDTSGSNVF